MIHKCQLLPGEEIRKATLDDGRTVEVLARKGHSVYGVPGRPANLCQVGDLPPMPEQHFFFTRLADKTEVQIQVNAQTGEVCVSAYKRNRGRDFRISLL